MIGTHIQKILGDITARRGRTSLVVMAIFLGVAGTIAMFSMRDILLNQLKKDVREDELAMLTVDMTASPTSVLDNVRYLDDLSRQPNVTAVAGYLNTRIAFKLSPTNEAVIDGFIKATSRPFDAMTIEPVRLYRGRFPAHNAHEIAIERRMADEYGLKIGDVLYLQVMSPDESGARGTVQPYTISGIVFDPYLHSVGQEGLDEVRVEPQRSIYSTLADATNISGMNGFSSIYARFTDIKAAEAGKQAFIDYVSDQTPYIINHDDISDPADNRRVTATQTLGDTLRSLAMAALLVSGFLVTNVISSIVVEQKRQIGILKAMGGSRRDIFVIYGGLAFTYGVMGVIPGIIIGIPGGYWAAKQISPQLHSIIVEDFQVSALGILVGVVMGLLVPTMAAMVPVWRGSRVSVLDAITDIGIDADYGSGLIARMLAILPLPMVVRQGLSNVSMKKARLVFTVLTLTTAVGVSMGIYGLFNRVTSGISSISDTATFDATLTTKDELSQNELITLVTESFNTGDGAQIRSIEPGALAFLEIEGYEAASTVLEGGGSVQAAGFDVTSATPPFDFTLLSGDLLTAATASDGIMISETLAANAKKQVGDTLTVIAFDNRTLLTVVGVVEYPAEEIWLDWHTLALIIGHTQGAPIPNQYITTLNVDDYTEPLSAIGIDDKAAEIVQLVDGRFPETGETSVVVSEAMATVWDYRIGDTLALSVMESPNHTVDYTIVGIVNLPPALAGDWPNEMIAMPWRELAALEGLDLTDKPIPQMFYVTTNLVNPTVKEIDAVIKRLDHVLEQRGTPVLITNYIEQTESTINTYNLFQLILQAAAALIGLVGAVGLLSTLSMSVFERQREIGVMRSVGARSFTIASQFLTEGISVGIIAWIAGIPLALGVYALLLNVTGFSDTITAGLPVASIGFGLGSVLMVVTLASLLPSISAARRTVADIIRYQ